MRYCRIRAHYSFKLVPLKAIGSHSVLRWTGFAGGEEGEGNGGFPSKTRGCFARKEREREREERSEKSVWRFGVYVPVFDIGQ